MAETEFHLHIDLEVQASCDPTVVQAASQTPRLVSKTQFASLPQAVAEEPYRVRQVGEHVEKTTSQAQAKATALHSV